MAVRDPAGNTNYWYQGAPSSLIISNINNTPNEQSYWYMGEPLGYLYVSALGGVVRARTYAVLIGF